MPRLNKNIIKKMNMNSKEFEENDYWIVEGTPQYLWNEFWDLMNLASSLNREAFDISKPLNRNVARKIYVK